jgi:hypothetical protein
VYAFVAPLLQTATPVIGGRMRISANMGGGMV